MTQQNKETNGLTIKQNKNKEVAMIFQISNKEHVLEMML
jgi:hypothetical protein